MVNLRRIADLNKPKPTYDEWSFECTLVMHYGGNFSEEKPEYIGGGKLVFDFVNANRVKYEDLVVFAGMKIKGKSRFYRLLKGGFNLIKESNDLQDWAKKHMRSREIHIYASKFDPRPHLISECTDFTGVDCAVGTAQEGEQGNLTDEIEEEPEFVIGDEVDSDEERNVVGKLAKGKEKVVEPTIDPAYVESEKNKESSESSEEECDVVHDEIDDFDENRVSDGECDRPRYPVFNPKTIFKPTFTLEQCFSSKQEFRKAVQSHAILTKKTLIRTKNDANRVYVECKGNNCTWRMRLHKVVGENCWQLREYNDKHTKCAIVYKVKNLKSTWLSERYIQRFQSDANRSISGFREDTVNDVEVEVSRQQAYRAKKKALELIQGNPNDQFGKLWSYADELRKTNPGSTIILGVDGENRFTNFYVCLDALKKGFLGGCRPLIGVDGCFLKSVHGGILLTAVGVDPNNNLYPIAYSVVASEITETWEWFFTILKNDLHITNPSDYTFISDKQKGLVAACGSVFPGAEHRFCVRHLHNNMKSAGWTGLMFKNMLWAAAQATTTGEFRVKMRQMREYNQFAWEWFNDKPPNQWSKAFFREKVKCDMLLNNACESFNSTILEARDKPIITMLEWIRVYLMTRLQKNRDRAMAKWQGKICPKIAKIMEIYQERVSDFIPLKCNNQNYQVSSRDGTQYTVNLGRWTCSCRSWDLTGIPCKHALCAILSQDMDPDDFVDRFYYVETYIKVYEPAIMGISYEALWGDAMYIPPLPPSFGKKKRGRPPIARRREADEPKSGGTKRKAAQTEIKKVRMKRQQDSVKCGKCFGTGHNSRSKKCPLFVPEATETEVPNCPQTETEITGTENVVKPTEIEQETHSGDQLRGEMVTVTPKGKKARGRPRKASKPSKPSKPDPNFVKPPKQIPPQRNDEGESLEVHCDQDWSNLRDFMGIDRQLQEGPSMYQQLLTGTNGEGSANGQGVKENVIPTTENQLRDTMITKNKKKTQKKVKASKRGSLRLLDEDDDDTIGNYDQDSNIQLEEATDVVYEFPPITQPSQDHVEVCPSMPTAAPLSEFHATPPAPVKPGVQIRAPAPFVGGLLTAAWIKRTTVQPEGPKKLVVDKGMKYMDLSLPPTELKKK